MFSSVSLVSIGKNLKKRLDSTGSGPFHSSGRKLGVLDSQSILPP